jgi:hypothetical protein
MSGRQMSVRAAMSMTGMGVSEVPHYCLLIGSKWGLGFEGL